MTLENLGYNIELESYRKEKNFEYLQVGRVITEHKERYIVKNAEAEYDAEILGNLRYSAQDRSDFPAVGDWVAFMIFDETKALIYAIFPRKTTIERQAVGKYAEKQIIATNIDFAFIVQAVDRDFNINRIERYLTICYASGISPIILLNKIDLIEEDVLSEIVQTTQKRVLDVPIISISNEKNIGIEQLKSEMALGKSYCLLGSSGVGKSTLSNNLSGKAQMEIGEISEHSNRGKHVTSRRELIILDNGAILIDNPGMREVGIADSSGGLERTFELIEALSEDCKFSDCTHTQEMGCAVLEVLESGELDEHSYKNYMRMLREKEHFESTKAEKRKKGKEFSKMVKQVMKNKKGKRF